MSAREEFNAVHKWTGEIFGPIKRKKLRGDMAGIGIY